MVPKIQYKINRQTNIINKTPPKPTGAKNELNDLSIGQANFETKLKE